MNLDEHSTGYFVGPPGISENLGSKLSYGIFLVKEPIALEERDCFGNAEFFYGPFSGLRQEFFYGFFAFRILAQEPAYEI